MSAVVFLPATCNSACMPGLALPALILRSPSATQNSVVMVERDDISDRTQSDQIEQRSHVRFGQAAFKPPQFAQSALSASIT